MGEKLKIGDLKETLASAEAELDTLEKRVEALKEWIAVTRKLCSKSPKLSVNVEATFVPRMRRTKTADLTNQISEVLQEKGGPMHVRDIVIALAEKGQPMTAQNKDATVAIALSRRPDQFQKTGPNTFALASVTPQQTATAVTMAS
jgi:hypothetical protein